MRSLITCMSTSVSHLLCSIRHKKLRIHSHKPLLMCVDANLISQERNMINSVNSIGHSRAPQREVEEWTARSLSCCVLSHKKLRICFSAALFLFGVELPNCLYSACWVGMFCAVSYAQTIGCRPFVDLRWLEVSYPKVTIDNQQTILCMQIYQQNLDAPKGISAVGYCSYELHDF